MHVRELPPLRLHILATAPNGNTFRWGDDERRPEDTPSGIGFTSIVPGGHETLECELPRKMELDYEDLQRLTTLTAIGAGGRIASEARLEKAPRASGETLSVSPQAVGWQAHLADDEGASEVYVDRDLSHWQGLSNPRRIAVIATPGNVQDHSVDPDTTTGLPALHQPLNGPWAALAHCESWYDAGPGLTLGDIYHEWSHVGSATFEGTLEGADDEVRTNVVTGTDRLTASPQTGSNTETAANGKRWAAFRFRFSGAVATENDRYWSHTRVAVWGNHGLTKRGTAPNDGLYASDIVAHAVGKWAPALRFTTGSGGTIAPTALAIPQLEFREMTTADVIIKSADRFHLRDWAVWEGRQPNQPTFYYQDRGARGRRWRARVRPSQLEETGPQIDKLFNGVCVRYTDAAGTSLTVGPTGSAADTTSALLTDTDPLNPANQMGIKRHTTLDIGIPSTAAAATEVGKRFLEESKLHDQSGSAELVGYVEDDCGVVHPAWAVRAGDEITFTDAADPSSRRIVRASYEHDSRTTSVDLDAPPEGMDSLLERLGVAVAPAGPAGGGAGGFFGSAGMGGASTAAPTKAI